MKKGNKKCYAFFAGPAIFCFLSTVGISFVYGIYLTMTDWDGIADESNFVGIRNYITTFQNTEFWSSLKLTFFYVLISAVLVNAVAFLLAYLLTSGIKGQNFMRSGFFIPNLIGGIVLGYIWQFIFSRVLVLVGKSMGWKILEKSWLSSSKMGLVHHSCYCLADCRLQHANLYCRLYRGAD